MRAALVLAGRLALVTATLAACERNPSTAAASVAASTAAAAPSADAPTPSWRRCRDSAAPATTGRGFEHTRSGLVAMAGANHAVQDFVAVPGRPIEVSAKISYGDVGKDLEDEPIEVLLDDCTSLAVRGTAKTDDDGIARLEITAPGQPGAYDLQFRVVGDGTMGRATLNVLPAGTQLVVFDIDGTLTVDDAEVTHDVLDEHFRHIRSGEYSAAAYEHGAALAGLWAERGFVIVYLTGRPYWLVDHTRRWLQDGKYPAGILRTTVRHRDVVPNVDGVGAFKAGFLRSLQDAGFRIVAAHGNATTDVWAYAQAGVAPGNTYIIGPHAGEGGTVAVRGDWSAVLALARGHAAADQPFSWR